MSSARARPVDVVLVPYDSGVRGWRMGAGPERLVGSGLAGALAEHGHDVRVHTLEKPDANMPEIASAFALATAVRDAVRAARLAGRLPLVLAGNCIAGVGAVAALGGDTSVAWFDAHADLNTPETTTSGFLDGMAVSVLLGRCWRALAAGIGLEPVAESRVLLLGARDLDPPEAAYLRRAAVELAPVTGWERQVDAFAAAATGGAYLHIDLDVLDTSVGRANAFAASGGFTLEALRAAVARIAATADIGAVTFSAYDPEADADGAVARAAAVLAAAVAATQPPMRSDDDSGEG